MIKGSAAMNMVALFYLSKIYLLKWSIFFRQK